jgi:hypothetical protein
MLRLYPQQISGFARQSRGDVVSGTPRASDEPLIRRAMPQGRPECAGARGGRVPEDSGGGASASSCSDTQCRRPSRNAVMDGATGPALRVAIALKLSESPSSRGSRAKLTTPRAPVSGHGFPLWHGSGRQRGLRGPIRRIGDSGRPRALAISLDSLVRLLSNAFFPSPTERIDDSPGNPSSAE